MTYLARILKTTVCTMCLIGVGWIGFGSPIMAGEFLARAEGAQEYTKTPVILTALQMDRIAAGAAPVPYLAFGMASAVQQTKERSHGSSGDGVTGRQSVPGRTSSPTLSPLILAWMRAGAVGNPPVVHAQITHELSHVVLQRAGRD